MPTSALDPDHRLCAPNPENRQHREGGGLDTTVSHLQHLLEAGIQQTLSTCNKHSSGHKAFQGLGLHVGKQAVTGRAGTLPPSTGELAPNPERQQPTVYQVLWEGPHTLSRDVLGKLRHGEQRDLWGHTARQPEPPCRPPLPWLLASMQCGYHPQPQGRTSSELGVAGGARASDHRPQPSSPFLGR